MQKLNTMPDKAFYLDLQYPIGVHFIYWSYCSSDARKKYNDWFTYKEDGPLIGECLALLLLEVFFNTVLYDFV